MAVTSFNHPRDGRQIHLHEWQIQFCGSPAAAAVFSFFDYWHALNNNSRKRDAYLRRLIAQHGGDGPAEFFDSLTDWQFHTYQEIADAIMIYGRTKVVSAVAHLVDLNCLAKKRNPLSNTDQTQWFRFNPEPAMVWLQAKNGETYTARPAYSSELSSVQDCTPYERSELIGVAFKTERSSINSDMVTYMTTNMNTFTESAFAIAQADASATASASTIVCAPLRVVSQESETNKAFPTEQTDREEEHWEDSQDIQFAPILTRATAPSPEIRATAAAAASENSSASRAGVVFTPERIGQPALTKKKPAKSLKTKEGPDAKAERSGAQKYQDSLIAAWVNAYVESDTDRSRPSDASLDPKNRTAIARLCKSLTWYPMPEYFRTVADAYLARPISDGFSRSLAHLCQTFSEAAKNAGGLQVWTTPADLPAAYALTVAGYRTQLQGIPTAPLKWSDMQATKMNAKILEDRLAGVTPQQMNTWAIKTSDLLDFALPGATNGSRRLRPENLLREFDALIRLRAKEGIITTDEENQLLGLKK